MKNAIVLCSGGVDSVTTAHFAKKKMSYEKLIILFFNYGQKSLEGERKASKKCAGDLNAEFMEIELKWLGEISTSLINCEGDIKKLERRDLKDTNEESKRYYVPCRNVIFLSYALALAEARLIKNKEKFDIFTGFKCEGKESYPDTTKEFVEKMNELSKIAAKGFGIITPLIEKDKEDIILLGGEMGINFRDTFSCYVGERKHCGKCLACMLRKEGFHWAGLKDETDYES